jgi:hypothetical protein
VISERSPKSSALTIRNPLAGSRPDTREVAP